jgi:flagellar biosynthesis protein FlhF
MKMKRYFAPDSRQALRALRDEQGPEAVIISNRRVKGGVEIIAAMDYEDSMINTSLGNPNGIADKSLFEDNKKKTHPTPKKNTGGELDYTTLKKTGSNIYDDSSSHVNEDSSALNKIQNELKCLRDIMEAPLMQFSWGETDRVQPLYASLLKQLMSLGLSSKLSQTIANRLDKEGLSKHSWLESVNHIADMVPVYNEDILSTGGIVSLVGPTGVGKTTTIAKLAARYALKYGRRCVTLITTDNYRIGAHEQLRSYGRILGIPVHVASDSEELNSLIREAKDASGEYHLILIDTAGVCQKDIRLTEQISALDISGIDIKNFLVMSATGQMNLQDEVIRAFSRIKLKGCIITKIDEAASLGEIISVLIQRELPVSYICNGQKVPDDLYKARGKLLVKEAIKLMRNLNKSLSDEELAYSFGGVVNNANI